MDNDTPLVNANLYQVAAVPDEDEAWGVVDANFARTLERRLAAAEAERDKWRGLEREAANHVEIVICMRSPTFTGEEPYVGWKGLGLALRADYDALAAAEARVRELERAAKFAMHHVTELREAWERGIINERDGQGSLRSNRNAEVDIALRAALADPPKGATE